MQDFVEDAVRYAVGRSIANASAMAWGAAVKAWAEYAKAQAVGEALLIGFVARGA